MLYFIQHFKLLLLSPKIRCAFQDCVLNRQPQGSCFLASGAQLTYETKGFLNAPTWITIHPVKEKLYQLQRSPFVNNRVYRLNRVKSCEELVSCSCGKEKNKHSAVRKRRSDPVFQRHPISFRSLSRSSFLSLSSSLSHVNAAKPRTHVDHKKIRRKGSVR